MDKIQSMQVFVRVAELNNFTRAAESLGLPKGSVSRLVQQLETRMATRLLHRSTRRVQLTQDGQVFYERCKELLANMDELETMFQSNPAMISGRLRVDMPLTMATHLVLPRLTEFLNRYPALEIELSSTDHRVDVVREGFDCVIRVGHLKDSGLIARPLGHLSVLNCASPGYLERYGTPDHPDQLSQHAMVNYDHALGNRSNDFLYLDGKELKTVKSGGSVTVNSTETYAVACVAGLGIIQVPILGIGTYLTSGQLVSILPKFRAPPMPVSLVYPHRRHISRRVKIFMDWLSDIMQAFVV
ncbi:MAG: LysR family transcriptional regulator [Rouxiella aceris]|uniref:LysR family transcriptional regulator n=1 Tax=Rouxiella aceris TaxID=2703884 RepID=UPI00284129BC|nr:LysR family transcriptional regulator [Rouxiella aceris]MDR3431189.1 LysR family transcriptional regulator [Rouxiella aceris]